MVKGAWRIAGCADPKEHFSRSMVRFENVGMRYGAGPEVLRDISFALAPGSFTFLTGPSGAGKSTLLRLVFLAEKPSRGSISLFGCDLSMLNRADLPPLRRRVGVVFQDFRLLDHLTAFDNVVLPLRLQGRRPADYTRDVHELMSWVGLGDKLHVKPPTLSGGEQQRVAIARAIVARPDLLLADEPTGNVDPDMGDRLIRLFVELNRFGTTVMIATHDRALIESTPAREMRLIDGRLIEMRGQR
jgi:cell division transport system ATP-binding protein